MTLDQLQLGDHGTIVSLETTGAERRRLMDLGMLPGTRITAHMTSPLGDPTAYLVRGSLIALRRSQARGIEIRDEERD